MTVVIVIMKTLKEVFRDKGSLAILFLSPIIFFSFFGFIYTPTNVGTVYYNVGLVNQDIGMDQDLTVIIPASFSDISDEQVLGQLYVDVIGTQQGLLVDSEVVLQISLYQTQEDMTLDIEKQNLNLGVVIPEEFTSRIVQGYYNLTKDPAYNPDLGIPVEISMYGDQSQSTYFSTYSLVVDSLESFADQIYGISRLNEGRITVGEIAIASEYKTKENLSNFQYSVAGFLVFNTLLQMITTSRLLASEKEKKTINRIKLSQIQPWEFMLGLTFSQVILFMMQFLVSIPILIFWHITLSAFQWFNIGLILLITSVTLTGLSLMVASVVKSADDASSVTGISSAPLGFLSGSFLPVPDVYIIRSLNFQFWDLIPTAHATAAVTDIVIDASPLGSVLRPLIFLIIYGLLFYGFGVLLFNRKVIHGNLS